MTDIADRLREVLDAHDPRTIEQMKADDHWQDGIVTTATRSKERNSWSVEWKQTTVRRPGSEPVECDGGTYGCGFAAKDGIEVNSGSMIRIYSEGGFGSYFHGVEIDDKEVFYETPLERVAKTVKWLANHDREQRDRFVEQRPKLDAMYDELPPVFKARIDRFRAKHADFRIKDEYYELFCVSQGAKFAARAIEACNNGENDEAEKWWSDEKAWRSHFSHTDYIPPTQAAARWLGWWWALSSKEFGYDHQRQKKLMPEMDEGHSGNTFGGACSLGMAYLEGTEF